MDEIKDADYMDGKRVCKYREIKRLYKIDQLDLPKFLSAPGIACKAVFKITEVKLELLIDIDLLLVVERGTSREKI